MERDEKPADFLLPDAVKTWFTSMYKAFKNKNCSEMATLYDSEFYLLTNNYYKQIAWPDPAAIESLVEHHDTFLILYKQIYFRHMFSRLQPDFYKQIDSWNTYCTLFDGIINQSIVIEALPSQWVFDLVGEFVYQHQSFCQYRANEMQYKDSSEYDNEEGNIWSTSKVYNYLHRLIKTSKILEQLAKKSSGDKLGSYQETALSAKKNILLELGYFTVITLARAQVLIGDYYTSLSTLSPIDFQHRALGSHDKSHRFEPSFQKSLACHVSVFYHKGFAQMMLGQFDCARETFCDVLEHLQRTKYSYSRSGDQDQLGKLSDKMLALLCILLDICPGQDIKESIKDNISAKYGDKQNKLQKGDTSALTELFTFACPKFISPTQSSAVCGEESMNEMQHSDKELANAATTGSKKANTSEAMQRQLQLFSDIVSRQQYVPQLRSYIKLYRSIEISKLARFRNFDVTSLRAELMEYRLKTRGQKVDVHYVIDNDSILIDDAVTLQRSGDFFMQNIHQISKLLVDNRAD